MSAVRPSETWIKFELFILERSPNDH
jgi:hypothetical protein